MVHVDKEGLEVIPSTAASGMQKTSGSGQAAPSLDLGVCYEPPNCMLSGLSWQVATDRVGLRYVVL